MQCYNAHLNDWTTVLHIRRRYRPAVFGLLLIAAGCISEERKPLQVIPERAGPVHRVVDKKEIPPSFERKVDLGPVPLSTVPEQVFCVHNSSGEAFKVVEVRKSCGCQEVDLTSGTSVLQDEVFSFTYRLPSAGGGETSGRLKVTTDSKDPLFKEMTFELRAELPRLIWTHPTALFFARSDALATPETTKEIVVQSDIRGLFDYPIEIKTCRSLVDVTVSERSGERLVLRATLSSTAGDQDSHDLIRIRTDDPHRAYVSVRVRAGENDPAIVHLSE